MSNISKNKVVLFPIKQTNPVDASQPVTCNERNPLTCGFFAPGSNKPTTVLPLHANTIGPADIEKLIRDIIDGEPNPHYYDSLRNITLASKLSFILKAHLTTELERLIQSEPSLPDSLDNNTILVPTA